MRENHISTRVLKRLLISHNLVIAGRVFFEIFLNLFIWKQTESLVLVAWFNIVYLLMHTISFHVFAGIVKKGKVHFPRKLGLLGYTVVFFVISILGDKAIEYVFPIAFFIGIFNGMYWISYQIIRFDLTNSKNRGNYTGMEHGMKIFVDILMPAVGGAIIAANIFGLSYSILFLFGALMFFVSFFIGNVEIPTHDTIRFHFTKTFSIIRKDKDIMKTMLAYVFGSMSRGGTIARLLLPLLIFDVLKNEFQLGGLLSFFSVIAIISSVAFGKFISYRYFRKSILIGGISFFLLILALIYFPSLIVYVLLGISFKIVDIMIRIPKRVISENLIHSIKDFPNHRIEYIVIREWFNIGLGRFSSFVLLLTAGSLIMEQMKFALILMAIGVLVETILLWSIKREF